jgi:NADPH:quinone reductase-like Zn-dependent oxidoreductase
MPRAVRFDRYGGAIGFTNGRASHAKLVLVEPPHITARPPEVPWEVAGALPIAGMTAYAAVRAVAATSSETVVVSGGAGGVGSIAVQLAGRAGATVLGLASDSHHGWPEAHGVVPVG